MNQPTLLSQDEMLLGNEAVALGAIHAGLSAAYGYPGTPSTEILEYVLSYGKKHGTPHASWCANEKTALETALGVSFVGRRALVTMKHVGLNVAADAFINAAIVSIHGGVVVAVADDPGMHSSQNEQDSRYLADFAHVLCLEPANQQQAYDMTREAFDLSERFHVPVLLRLVTRLSHSRSIVHLREPQSENAVSKVHDRASWILLPTNARRQWHELLDEQVDMIDYSDASPHNELVLGESSGGLGVITTGIARNYFDENVADLAPEPSHLHIGAYPLPVIKIRQLAKHVARLLVLEEGYPYVERLLRGLLPTPVEIMGRGNGHVPREGELTPDSARKALGLEAREGMRLPGFQVPKRPPQLCAGCPHRNSYDAIQKAVAGYKDSLVASDIGCYTLGALPPYSVIETCVCMGASLGIAKGASEAGLHPTVAVIGDSTFYHSGITPLIDAVSADANMTIVILDNGTVAMTGTQRTILPGSKLRDIVCSLGVHPDHVHVVEAHPKKSEENAAIIRREIEHEGLSVVIFARECLESARKRKNESRTQ